MTKILLYTGLVILIALFIAGVLLTAKRYNSQTPWEERAAIPWGIMVPSYAFFASSAAGLAFIASILLLYNPLDKAVVSLVRHMYILVFGLLIPAWYIVFADLGRPDHGTWLLRGWNPSSRIAWMPVFYAILALPVFLILVHNVFGSRERFTSIDKVLAVVAIVGGLGLEINLGQVFGNAISLQGLTSPNLGLVFLVAAFGLGAAWATIIIPLTLQYSENKETRLRLRKTVLYSTMIPIAAASLILGLAIAWWGSYAAVHPPTRIFFDELTSGAHAALFYGVEILLGYILAPVLAVVALYRGSWISATISSLFFLIAGFTEKYDLIIGAEEARLKATYLGSIINPYHVLYQGTSYHVGVDEAIIVLGAAALGFLVYVAIELLLPKLLSRKD